MRWKMGCDEGVAEKKLLVTLSVYVGAYIRLHVYAKVVSQSSHGSKRLESICCWQENACVASMKELLWIHRT